MVCSMKIKYAHRGHLSQEGYPEYGRENRGDAHRRQNNVASWMGGKMWGN